MRFFSEGPEKTQKTTCKNAYGRQGAPYYKGRSTLEAILDAESRTMADRLSLFFSFLLACMTASILIPFSCPFLQSYQSVASGGNWEGNRVAKGETDLVNCFANQISFPRPAFRIFLTSAILSRQLRRARLVSRNCPHDFFNMGPFI